MSSITTVPLKTLHEYDAYKKLAELSCWWTGTVSIMLPNMLIASPHLELPHTSTLTFSGLVSSGYRGKGCPRAYGHRKDHRGIQSLGCLGSPTLQHELKENLKVTEQKSRSPQSLCPALNPTNTLAAAARLFDHYTTALAKLAEFRRGSMRNHMQVFPKYPHILEKHKLGSGQLNSTLIWAAWLFSTKTCCA